LISLTTLSTCASYKYGRIAPSLFLRAYERHLPIVLTPSVIAFSGHCTGFLESFNINGPEIQLSVAQPLLPVFCIPFIKNIEVSTAM
jgi:hypothetical protein